MQAGRDAHLMSTVLSAWTKFVNEQYILVRGPATGPAVRGSYKPLQAVLISCPPLVEEPPSVFLESARNKRCFVVGNCRKKRSIMRSVPHLPLRRPSIFIFKRPNLVQLEVAYWDQRCSTLTDAGTNRTWDRDSRGNALASAEFVDCP